MRDEKKYYVPASQLPSEPVDFRDSIDWRIFRIMAEFIEGYQFIYDFKKSVTIFGSARRGCNEIDYVRARKLGAMLAKDKFTVVTGGGPGVMEAANRGAAENNGISVGLNIQLPVEQRVNEYVNKPMGFNYFFTRKTMMSQASSAYVFFPGGFGTLDEFYEIITLIQTKKIAQPVLVIVIGKEFWDPLMAWMKQVMLKEKCAVSEEDLQIINIVDTPEEAFKMIKTFAKKIGDAMR